MSYKDLIKAILQSKKSIIVIHGMAGTGKSHFIENLTKNGTL